MARVIGLPDGTEGEFPDDMSDAEIEAVLQKQFLPSPPPPAQDLPLYGLPKRPAGRGGVLPGPDEDQGALVRRRINALLQGVGGTTNYLSDLSTRATNTLGLTSVPEAGLPSNRFEKFLTQLGLDQPSPTEKVVGGLLGGRADPASSLIAGSLVKQPPLYNAPAADALGRPLPRDVAPARSPLETPTRTAAREQGMASNYKFAPGEVPGTPMGNIGEYLSPSPELRASLSRDNLRTLNANIAREITLPTGESVGAGGLTRPALRDLSNKAWDIGYKPIADLGLPTPLNLNDVLRMQKLKADPDVARRVDAILTNAGALDPLERDSGSILSAIRDLRKSADKAFKTDPDMATSLKGVSDVLEGTLSRHLAGVPGGPEAFNNYLGMRTKIAQIQTAKRALGPGGNIDAKKLATVAAKDAPLTGEFRTAAEAADSFPTLFQIPKTGEMLQTERTTGPVGSALYRAITLAGYPARKWLGHPSYQARLQQAGAHPLGNVAGGKGLLGGAIQASRAGGSIFGQPDAFDPQQFDAYPDQPE